MDRAATAEPPLAAQAAEVSRAGQAAPLDGALAAIPLGDEGIAAAIFRRVPYLLWQN
jgi:hypothetical protein